jgi:predicted CoA-binding protein
MSVMSKKTLVFGASLKPGRYSYLAIHKLLAHGLPVSAFGTKSGTIAGVRVDTQLNAFDGIDTITMYLNPKNQKAYYSDIVSLGPRRIIFNPGSENPDFYSILSKHKIHIEEACTLTLLATDQY